MSQLSEFDPSTIDFPADVSNSGGSAASGRESYVACPTKWVNNFLRKLEKPTNIHLHAGGAFAKGMEVSRQTFFSKGGTEEDARLVGLAALEQFYGQDYADLWANESKSLPQMRGALTSYQRKWQFADDFLEPFDDSTMGVEFDFALPIDVLHPQTGERILYRGRIDWLAKSKSDGQVWVIDDKTTSQLGASWSRQWNLDSQPTGYVWACRQFGIPVAGVILRGTSILAPDRKTGERRYGHEESLQPRTSFMIEDWYAQLCQDVEDMIGTWKAFRSGGRVRKMLDKSACNAYGGCAYVQSCSSSRPEAYFSPPRDLLAAPAPIEMGGLLDGL